MNGNGTTSACRTASAQYGGFLRRGAAVNCGVGVAIGVMGGVWDGISVVLLGGLGLIAAASLLRAVDACADMPAVVSRNGGRDRD